MAAEDEVTEEKTLPPVKSTEVNKTAPREKLVRTAVHFLTNPKVAAEGSPHQKKAFLISKGLTEQEIALAFERVNAENPSSRTSHYFPVPERSAPLQPAPSLWMRINHIGSSVIIIAIACYGIHRIYKIYIEPWLFGEQHKDDRLTEMERQLVELNRSLSHLRRAVGTIEDTLASQKTQLSKLCEEAIPSSELLQNPLIFNDIKSEITSIKSLLLGRQRFPPAPNVSPMIPSWQLETASTEKKSEEESPLEKENVPDEKEEEENTLVKSVSNGLESNSASEDCNKSCIDEVVNCQVVNGDPEDSPANQEEA